MGLECRGGGQGPWRGAIIRRLSLALVALFLTTGLAMSVLLSAALGVSRARESVSQGLIAEGAALPKNSAANSQYSENPTAANSQYSENPTAANSQYSDDPTAANSDPTAANSQYSENPLPESPTNPGEASRSDSPDSEGFVSQGSIVRGPAPPKEDFSPYSKVVDNSSPKRFRAPGWDIEFSDPHSHGRDYRVAKPSQRTKPARFRFKLPASDVYSVYAWWPAQRANNANNTNNTAARFGISTTSGVRWTKVDQREDGGFWVKLGAYEMESGNRHAVRVSPASEEGGYVMADAVKIVRGKFASPVDRDGPKASSHTQGSATSGLASGHFTGLDVVRLAREHIGTPYKHSPPYTCQAQRSEDCSCHTELVFEKLDIELPDDPVGQWGEGRRVAKPDLRPGDLVFFKERGPSNPITHVGIYSGYGNLIHSSAYFGEIVESKMEYIKGYYGARRL